MKIIHLNKELKNDSFETAGSLEQDGKYEEAAAVYQKLIKANPLLEKGYDRLMIIYRKLKEPKAELEIINKGISAFEKLYKRPREFNKKVISISKALQKATGLADKKGNSIYDPQPLDRWKKRRRVVEKLLKKVRE
jgi:tetratricopeptide (TPR) repeat protein